MATKRKFQLLAKVEDQPGVVASSLVNVANAKILVSDPQITFDRETFERNINRSSLTPLTPLEGVVEATASFRVEMAGTTSAAGTAPDWGILLQGCGFKQRTLGVVRTVASSFLSGGTASALFSGETVTSAISGQYAEAVHDHWEGSTRFYYADRVGGAFANGAITGGTSTAIANLTSVTDDNTHGIAWTPTSLPSVTITGTLGSGSIAAGDILVGATGGTVLQAVDGWSAGGSAEFYILDVGEFITGSETFQAIDGSGSFVTASSSYVTQTDWPALTLGVIEDGVIRVLKGCRGSVTFTANLGEPMFMDFEFRGLISSITDGLLSGTPSPTAKVPPSFLEIGYGVAKDSPAVTPANEHTPCINSWSAEYRNDISIERCASSTDGTRGSAFATARSVTGSFDPSVRPESSFDWLQSFRDGTTFRQRLTLGDTAANQFHLSLPACQISSEGGGDRNGLATRELQYSASGKNPAGNDAEDRELVLTYHQSQAFVR